MSYKGGDLTSIQMTIHNVVPKRGTTRNEPTKSAS